MSPCHCTREKDLLVNLQLCRNVRVTLEERAEQVHECLNVVDTRLLANTVHRKDGSANVNRTHADRRQMS